MAACFSHTKDNRLCLSFSGVQHDGAILEVFFFFFVPRVCVYFALLDAATQHHIRKDFIGHAFPSTKEDVSCV